ncbi:Fumarylacetoacetase [Bimuria novae-zelandiae CBS 107.79]|uniref:Fumarylacetoacetase n=1 Tax=Bimuria novae-zelandiae CBS 107.79 TaxID=1447943 RepID=A0A6A5UXH4_9PLEO|nr:Fumarylacetoacetase [Bimuria novae-zelandiae CBS 107.79]
MPPLRSWFSIPRGSHFSLANIPFGIVSTASNKSQRVAVAIGDHALDLEAFAANNGFSALSTIQPHQAVFSEPSLNAFAALGRPIHSVVRKYIQSVFAENTDFPNVLKNNSALQTQALLPLKEVQCHLPFKIGDYTDFFVGMNHAYNCGVMFRGPANALNPNYKHLPVGYHSRASSVVPSGTPIRRPHGQFLPNPSSEEKAPVYAPINRLDYELELGAFVCMPNKMGEPVHIGEAEDNLFGLVMLNDWSVRDVQSWEYIPLGPFNAKNFGTSISTWVVLMDALEPFKVKGIENDKEVLPYLKQKGDKTVYDIQLKVDLETNSGNSSTVANSNGRHLLWSFPQCLAHHTSTGCNLQTGDLLGSGTISGTAPEEHGCLLERTEGGKKSIKIGNEERVFLKDGDEVTFTGVCGTDEEALVGFGTVTGRIEPALNLGC